MGYDEIESLVINTFNNSDKSVEENRQSIKKISFILDRFYEEYSIEDLIVFCETDRVITVEFKCCILDFYLEYMKMLRDALNDVIFLSFDNDSDEYITVHAEIMVGK